MTAIVVICLIAGAYGFFHAGHEQIDYVPTQIVTEYLLKFSEMAR